MHLKRQCSLLMVLCSVGVLGYPRDTERQTAKRDAEREKDGSDSQARTLELKMNKAHPPYVSIHQQVFFLSNLFPICASKIHETHITA